MAGDLLLGLVPVCVGPAFLLWGFPLLAKQWGNGHRGHPFGCCLFLPPKQSSKDREWEKKVGRKKRSLVTRKKRRKRKAVVFQPENLPAWIKYWEMERVEGAERLRETRETHKSLITALLSISSENSRNQIAGTRQRLKSQKGTSTARRKALSTKGKASQSLDIVPKTLCGFDNSSTL